MQLTSLVDETREDPSLPEGHPFQGIIIELSQLRDYITTTTDIDDGEPWAVQFTSSIDIGDLGAGANGIQEGLAWCVRGGGF